MKLSDAPGKIVTAATPQVGDYVVLPYVDRYGRPLTDESGAIMYRERYERVSGFGQAIITGPTGRPLFQNMIKVNGIEVPIDRDAPVYRAPRSA